VPGRRRITDSCNVTNAIMFPDGEHKVTPSLWDGIPPNRPHQGAHSG